MREFTQAEKDAICAWYREHLLIRCSCTHMLQMFCQACDPNDTTPIASTPPGGYGRRCECHEGR